MADNQVRTLARNEESAEGRSKRVQALQRLGHSYWDACCIVYGWSQKDIGEREHDSENRRIRIDGELYHVTSVRKVGYGDIHEIETEEGEEFILSENSETAGAAARERWAEMAEHDPEEFACMVGNETLIKWGLGQPAGPGTTSVRSLSEWLDLWLETPEEEWARYDGTERTVDRCGKLAEELGFMPTVAYRTF